jgi:hypothetical protein
VKTSEDLTHAINATLVYAGVRQAARFDSGGNSSSFHAALQRNKLTVVKWAEEYEPLVIRAYQSTKVHQTGAGTNFTRVGHFQGTAIQQRTCRENSWPHIVFCIDRIVQRLPHADRTGGIP